MSADERKALAFVALLLGLSVLARAINRPEPVRISGATAVDIPTRIDQNRQVREGVSKPARATSPPHAPVAAVPAGPLDLNHASAEELDRLPGIGPAVAARIVEYRAAHGRFDTVEELDSVKGIGPALMAKLAPLVMVR